MRPRRLAGSALVTSRLLAATAAHGQVRTEILPIDSVTLSEQKFLTGVVSGPPARWPFTRAFAGSSVRTGRARSPSRRTSRSIQGASVVSSTTSTSATEDAGLVAYAGAHHGFDLHLARPSVWLANVQRGPTCDLEERPGGVMVLARTGEPFSFSHPCVVRGATIGYHAEAHRQAVRDVKSVLRSALRLPP